MGFLELAGESGASIGLLEQEISIETQFGFPSLRAPLDDVFVHVLTHLLVSWDKGALSLAALGALGAR